ncbi:MAG: DUF6460 domain-containing protein [Mesorhizobium sp.]
MSERLNRFLGGSPLGVLIKLVIVSLIVGFFMAFFGVSPWDVFYWIEDTLVRIWNMGFAALGDVAAYILLGAAIVVPAFIILRLLNWRR